MEEKKTMAVELTAEEMELLQEAREARAKEEAARRKEESLSVYKQMVDDAIHETVPEAERIEESMRSAKNRIVERFRAVVELKEELFAQTKALRDGRYSDTFTNSDSTARVSIGYNTLDNYDDTYTEGVAMVEEYIASLANDENSERLAEMVRMLLRERGKGGQLKAQNVLRLEQMAQESKDDTFIEGMRIIRSAYRPIRSKQYVKVEIKDTDTNEWLPIKMNMTNC